MTLESFLKLVYASRLSFSNSSILAASIFIKLDDLWSLAVATIPISLKSVDSDGIQSACSSLFKVVLCH